MATVTTVSEFKNAKRVHHALTASAEKRLLLWIAERLPQWVNSDHLTALGFVAQIFAGIGYALSHWNRFWLNAVCLFIVLNWLGDSLDGTLARVRNKQRPRYGFYVDHILDAFGATAMMTGLAYSGFIHWQIAIAMLVAFLLVSIESFLTTYTLGQFHLSHGLFGPTEIRILLIVGNLKLMHNPHAHLFGHEFLLFDIGGICGAAGMLAMAMFASVRHTMVLYREERI
jgi:phosphatidylglycerophosphate synthase